MMRIIPAIDIIDGKCVRLSQGDYNKKTTYYDDPLQVARMFEDAGIQYLHLVDLDGAKAKEIINYKVLENIAGHTNLKIDFGGGIKSHRDVKIAFECGARQITGGSIAVKEPDTFCNWLEIYGDKIILGADTRNRKIATNGWQEDSELDIITFLKNYYHKGVRYVICTDIQKDGMMEGPAFELYEEILSQLPDLKLIASGGISSAKDLQKLEKLGMDGAILGKAIYEGKINIKDLPYQV